MRLRETLLHNPDFTLRDDIFYENGFQHTQEFENLYIELRESEQRLYPDPVAQNLPNIPLNHPHKKEWTIRKTSTQRLISYLRRRTMPEQPVILEIGCGNGWLCNRLADLANSEVLGVDVNEAELTQAQRIFGNRKNVSFAYTDVTRLKLPRRFFDYIILASSIQYFSDADVLIGGLLPLLTDKGEIHVLDSPFYKREEIASAKERSREYFRIRNINFAGYYHHHCLDDLARRACTVMYDPASPTNRLFKVFKKTSPFPWLRITRER
jgi:ubiquinone/menaquinone biosynthesis C-methylase UbiE